MQTRWLLAICLIYLVAVVWYDIVARPELNLPILYAVPVLILAFTESALLVGLMSGLVVCLDLLSVVQTSYPLTVWGFTFAALLAVCFLSFQVAGQRAFIRREVEEAARAKWNALLLSEVAHELRTPLTVILGYAQHLLANPHLPVPLYRPVATIEQSARQMRLTVDDLAQRWKCGREDSTS
jgi:signal transduction histidine kinase